MIRKQSFLERLTGARTLDSDELAMSEENAYSEVKQTSREHNESSDSDQENLIEEEEAGLAVDLFETDNELIIQSMIAGVTPEHLHISISRDSVTIRGLRIAPDGITGEQFHIRELYWGPFSREIELPCEIDTDAAEAVEKYGLLIIRLPKLDLRKTAELKVKSI